MIKTGGIIAIIAGLLGLFAGFITLFLGGLGSAFSSSGAADIVSFGWGGILFSLLVVIYGGIAISKPKAGAVGIILSAILGIVLGGTLVAILMALALAGGIMAALGKPKEAPLPDQRYWLGVGLAAIAPVLCGILIGGNLVGSGNATANATVAPAITMLQIGQTARSDKFEVTVRSVRFTDVLGHDFMLTHADPGTLFAVLEVTVRGIDKESRFYSGGDLYANINGTMLKYDHSEIVLGVDSPMGTINPLTEKTGFVVYKIPASAANTPLSWSPGRDFSDVRFALAVSSPATAPAKPEPVPVAEQASTPTAEIASGSYVSPNLGTLAIQKKADGSLGFTLEVSSEQGNTGDAEGVLTPSGEAFIYKDADMDCLLILRPTANSIAITQEGGCGFGLNVMATGVYSKQ
jgi:hypothetical protein